MSRARRAWEQVGGPNAISKWSWIGTLPLAIVVGSDYATTPTLSEVLLWTVVIVLVHCAAGLLMWLAWRTVLPNRERRSRPFVAVVVFAGLGLVRGLLMQLAQDSIGFGAGVFGERMGVNILGTAVVLAAIAVVVDDYRVDVDIRRRLTQSTQTLDAVRANEESALRAADVEILQSVEAAVEAALSDAGQGAGEAKRVAEQIVRPISHDLADSASDVDLDLDTTDEPAATPRFAEAFADLKAPSPVLVAILVEASVAGAVVSRYGPAIALSNLMIGGGLVLLGSWSLRKFLPLPRSVAARIAVLFVAFALMSAVAAEVTSAVIGVLLGPFPIGIPGVMGGTAGASIVVALGEAVVSGRRQRLDAMATAVGEAAEQVEVLRSRVESRRLQAARFLHGPIQADLVAAAMRGEHLDEVRSAIARRFAEYGAVTRRPVEQQVTDVIASWASVLEICVEIEDEVWGVLDRDPMRADLIVDALSEGLTNAVRHATSRRVEIQGSVSEGRVLVRVVSDGIPDSRGSDGIGLAQLRSRGAEVQLLVQEARTTLAVAA